MNIIKKLSLFTFICSMLFLVSCEDDSNDPATSGTLNITINVTNPDSWPTEGTVFCSLDKTWPPSGAPYKSVVLQRAQVQNGQISLVFEDLDFDTYKLLSVSWLIQITLILLAIKQYGEHTVEAFMLFMLTQYLLLLVQKTLN